MSTPTPLPVLTAWQSYRKAWDHIKTRHLAPLADARQWQVRRSPDVVAVHAYVCRLAAWGDVAQTQQAAQVWLLVVKQALAAPMQEAA